MLICKIIIHQKTLVARYEIKFLFHKEILDLIRIFLNFPFSHLCECLAIGDVLIHNCVVVYIRSARLYQSQVLSSSHYQINYCLLCLCGDVNDLYNSLFYIYAIAALSDPKCTLHNVYYTQVKWK